MIVSASCCGQSMAMVRTDAHDTATCAKCDREISASAAAPIAVRAEPDANRRRAMFDAWRSFSGGV